LLHTHSQQREKNSKKTVSERKQHLMAHFPCKKPRHNTTTRSTNKAKTTTKQKGYRHVQSASGRACRAFPTFSLHKVATMTKLQPHVVTRRPIRKKQNKKKKKKKKSKS
jgi:hypothetical protein